MEVTGLKVLIIRAGALGDTLMLIPAIRQLHFDADIILAGRHFPTRLGFRKEKLSFS